MKTQRIKYLGIILLGFNFVLPAQADTPLDTVNAAQLQAAIEAFGVPTEKAQKATDHSAILIEEKRRASDKNNQDMLIVSDDFFTITPL